MIRTATSLTAVSVLIWTTFVVLEGGCGSDPWTIPCGPDAPCPTEGFTCWESNCLPPCTITADCPTQDSNGHPATMECIEGTCFPPNIRPNTGTANDAGDAGDAGKSSAICGESCKPVPDGWSSMQAFWVGPAQKAPFYSEFHGKQTLPQFIGRADLEATAAECDECSCGESTGKCTELPSSIEVHAGMCGEVSSSISFGGPTNWDGSCTSVNAIVGGQKCPVGSSTLCAQSITAAPLGAPVEESCMPFTGKLPVARARADVPTWKTAAVGYKVPGCDAESSCMPSINDLPSGFRSCIYQHGEHECPAAWNEDRVVVYEVSADKPGYVDGRDCTPCSCGAPMGSACTAQLRVFEDASCSKLVLADPLSSLGEQCTNIFPAGKAIGSKEITSLAYFPGMCEPLGGEPIGAAIPDGDQAITFCCPAAT